jgi:hypothetical protein
MRTRTAVLACTLVVAALLLAPAAGATGFHYGSCPANKWSVSVIAGPCPVANLSSPVCVSQGPYTGIQYLIGGDSYSNVATLATEDVAVLVPPPNKVEEPCDGDPVTGLGKRSCHEQAIRIHPVANTFWVVVDGGKLATETSVAVKKGNCIQSYRVAGLGVGTDAPLTERVTHGACTVEFSLDRVTGTVLSAKLTDDSDESCSLLSDVVENLEIKLGGQSLGNAQFGTGTIQSGTESCTTRVVGGRVYSWGSPCP